MSKCAFTINSKNTAFRWVLKFSHYIYHTSFLSVSSLQPFSFLHFQIHLTFLRFSFQVRSSSEPSNSFSDRFMVLLSMHLLTGQSHVSRFHRRNPHAIGCKSSGVTCLYERISPRSSLSFCFHHYHYLHIFLIFTKAAKPTPPHTSLFEHHGSSTMYCLPGTAWCKH